MEYLLVMPPNASKASGHNVFPVGLAYISAVLKQQNKKIHTLNLEYSETSYADLKQTIQRKKIDVICTSGLSRDFHKVKSVILSAKESNPSIISIVGGGIISGDPEPAMLALNADFGVIGQGEATIIELTDALEAGKNFDSIKGLIFKKGNMLTTTQPRSDIKDLDTIPFPDYDGFSFDQYMESINYAAVYLIASRSCPFNCTFCFHPSGSHYRQRPLDNLFAEIDLLISRYPVKKIVISDELFASNKTRVVDFCNRISLYDIKWDVQLRVSDVDKELLYTMKKAGCNQISYGIESADDKILKSMKKNISTRQIDTALRLTYDAELDIQGGLIFGDQAETCESVRKSLVWHKKNYHYGLDLNMINIFPGSELYKIAISKQVIRNRIQFLEDGCPLINITTLNNETYKKLASYIYEANISRKLHPEYLRPESFYKDGTGTFTLICDKCSTRFTTNIDLMHTTKINCIKCRKKYFIDPFEFLRLDKTEKFIHAIFSQDKQYAIWGAGEICLKLTTSIRILMQPEFVLIDISKSRQGYHLHRKTIHPPSVIETLHIDTILIATVKRQQEILDEIKHRHPQVKRVLIPYIHLTHNRQLPFLALREVFLTNEPQT